MKLFDIKFVLGTLTMAIGLACIFLGALTLLPPQQNIFLGFIALAGGVALSTAGRRIAKNSAPAREQVEKATLRHLKETRKHTITKNIDEK